MMDVWMHDWGATERMGTWVKCLCKNQFYTGYTVQGDFIGTNTALKYYKRYAISEQMNYFLHQNIQWVTFNICFLIQMFYICPRGQNLCLKCYFYSFLLCVMCKVEWWSHSVVGAHWTDISLMLSYLNEIENLKSSVRLINVTNWDFFYTYIYSVVSILFNIWLLRILFFYFNIYIKLR